MSHSLAVSVNLQMELHKLKKPMRTKSDVQAALREQVMFFFQLSPDNLRIYHLRNAIG